MKIKVLFFGIAREITGSSEREVEYDNPLRVKDLIAIMKDKYSDLNKLNSLLVAVNSEYAKDSFEINDGDEVAMIPPVAGG